jgi:hypothetical protein
VLSSTDWNTFNNKVSTTDVRLTNDRNPLAGSSNYIQNQTAASQAAGYDISGTAHVANNFVGNRGVLGFEVIGYQRAGLTLDLYSRVPPFRLELTTWDPVGNGRFAIGFPAVPIRAATPLARLLAADVRTHLFQEGLGFTVFAWARTGTKAGLMPVFHWDSACQAGQEISLSLAEGRLVGIHDPTGKAASLTGLTSVDDGKWHFVAFTHEESAKVFDRLYVDGKLDNEAVGTGGPMTAMVDGVARDAFIGSTCTATGASPPRFIGSIDGVRVYLRALSGGEITATFNSTAPLYVAPGPIAP